MLFIKMEGVDNLSILCYNIGMEDEIETICIHKHNVTLYAL